ncbi:MAG: hypothetical protein AAF748_01085 [Pseudomonadota bacterium]
MRQIVLSALLCLATLSAACANGWETFDHDLGAGAAVCPYDDAETGALFCFAIACLEAGGPVYIRIAVAGSTLDQQMPPLQIVVDGKPVARLFLDLLDTDDMLDFAKPLDRERDADLVIALVEGSRAMLVLGVGPSALIQEVTLRGSASALKAVPALCDQRPIVSEPD